MSANRRKSSGAKRFDFDRTMVRHGPRLGAAALQRSDWRALDSIGAELRKVAPRSPEGYLFQATANFNQGDTAEAEDYLKTGG